VRAIATFRVAREAEFSFVSELQNASIRAGRPYSGYEPERREIRLVDVLDEAVRRLASELANEMLEARAAEREAFVRGDGTA
jgi:hypothetical protein